MDVMLEKLKEQKAEEAASRDFSYFMMTNWNSMTGGWHLEDDIRKAYREGDQERVQQLEMQLVDVKQMAFQLEENIYLRRIESAIATKRHIAKHIASTAGPASSQAIAELTNLLTQTFDKDIWKAEQQLANHREKYKFED